MVITEALALGHDIMLIIADKLMRSPLLLLKQQGSIFPCEYCWLRSTVIDFPYQGGTKARHVYLFNNSCVPKTKADVQAHLEGLENKTEMQRKGYTGVSSLYSVPNFNTVIAVCCEYMHSMCLGCLKKLLALTFDLGAVNGVVKCHLRVAQANISVLNTCLAKAKSLSEFNRRLRIIDFANIKAEELRNLGLAYGLFIVLKLPSGGGLSEIWKRFIFLFIAYVCLSDDELSALRSQFDLRAFALQFEK